MYNAIIAMSWGFILVHILANSLSVPISFTFLLESSSIHPSIIYFRHVKYGHTLLVSHHHLVFTYMPAIPYLGSSVTFDWGESIQTSTITSVFQWDQFRFPMTEHCKPTFQRINNFENTTFYDSSHNNITKSKLFLIHCLNSALWT